MKAVSLDSVSGEVIAKALGMNEELTCEMQVNLLARALTACTEEFYRIAEIISVITPEHRAMPDEDVVAAAVSALYFSAPHSERQEILNDVFNFKQGTDAEVADTDKEVHDA